MIKSPTFFCKTGTEPQAVYVFLDGDEAKVVAKQCRERRHVRVKTLKRSIKADNLEICTWIVVVRAN